MLTPAQWWLVVAPMDLRGGMDRLLVHVRTVLGRDPFDGGAYVLTSFAVVKRLAIAAVRG
jgi:transposase